MSTTKVTCFLFLCLLNVPPLISGFVVKHDDMVLNSISQQNKKFMNVDSLESSKPSQVLSPNNTERRIASVNSPSSIQEGNIEGRLRNSAQPMNKSNKELHTRLKRSVCTEPSGADLEVQLQLFRSGLATTEGPTGAFGDGVDSLEMLRDTGFPVYWEGDGCGKYPSALPVALFPPALLSGRTACPWHLVLDSNSTRYPRDLQYVQCACRRCSEIQFDAFSFVNSCLPVLRDEHVLRRTNECKDGEFIYEPVLEPIPVACACIRPRLSTSNIDSN